MIPQLARHALAVGIGYTQVGHSSHERQISLAWRFVTDDTATSFRAVGAAYTQPPCPMAINR
jgi:hypothetical protein